ncbi:tetratricopeptide repeat protein [candidate division KSB1 bacterium]|nr:tetratricopeptide repeat protein [candidate division KSB1 bacterium]
MLSSRAIAVLRYFRAWHRLSKKLFILDTPVSDSYNELKGFSLKSRQTDPTPIEHLKQEAFKLKREKDYSKAAACFMQLLENEPKNDFYLSNIAHISYLQQQYRQAKNYAQQAISSNPKNWFALGILAELAYKNQDYKEACHLFEAALHLNPDDVYFITRLAYSYAKSGEPTIGIDLLKEALLKNPNEPRFYQNLGDLYKASGENDLAKESYQQGINLDPKNDYAFTQWVACMEAEKSREAILREVKRLLSLPSQKDNQFLRSYYAKLLSELGMVEESSSYLEDAVAADPRNLFRKTKLAASYNKQKRFHKALALLEPDYKNNVVDPFLFYELAQAYLGLEQKDQAKAILINGVKKFKDNQHLRRLLMRLR